MADLRPIDLIRQRIKAGRRAFEMEDFGITLYFTPLTQADVIAVEQRGAETQMEKNTLLVIQKAQLEDGTKAFAFGDKHALLNDVPLMTISQIVAFMYETGVSMNGHAPTDEEAVAAARARGKEPSKAMDSEPSG